MIQTAKLRNYPEIKQEFFRVSSVIFEQVFKHYGGLTHDIQTRALPEGNGTTVVQDEIGSYEYPMHSQRTPVTLTDEDIVRTQIEALRKGLLGAACQFAKQINSSFFEQMGEIIEKYGQSIHSSGKSVIKDILELLETKPLEFDAHGNISEAEVLLIPGNQLKTVASSLGLDDFVQIPGPTHGYFKVGLKHLYHLCKNQLPEPNENAKRLVKIVEEKKADFYAQESNRQLVD